MTPHTLPQALLGVTSVKNQEKALSSSMWPKKNDCKYVCNIDSIKNISKEIFGDNWYTNNCI